MSRAFLKNESADDPVVIPARAPLPAGITNYVTPRGLALLQAELAALETERTKVQLNETDETERTRQLALLNGRIGALNQRISSAKVVHAQAPAGDQLAVRFGATVTLRSPTNKQPVNRRQLTLVGVDEADAKQGLIAFTAPIARLLLGKHIGEQVMLPTVQGTHPLEIEAISYNEPD